jgi:hypothetical protein
MTEPLVAPVFPPPVPGRCTAGPGPCGTEPARLYPCGWRCVACAPGPAIKPSAPEPDTGPASVETPRQPADDTPGERGRGHLRLVHSRDAT